MSIFCPKCSKRTYDEYICDYCQYEIKPNNYKTKKEINFNNNKITISILVVIAIAVSYLAINKLTEDTPQEKTLKALYGTSNKEEIKKINKEIIKESEKVIEESGKKEIEMFNKFVKDIN